MVNIMTINVNGLRKRLTRQTILREIHKLNVDVCFIQESFITENVVEQYNKYWKGELLYTPGTEHSLGTIILFDKCFEYSELDTLYKSERLLCVKFKHDQETFLCINVYYPNESNQKCQFHNEVTRVLNMYSEANMNIIIGGDFNCIANRNLDNMGGNPHNAKEIKAFNEWIEQHKLFDIWRMHNAEDKYYTWKHKNRPIMRRIDYIFCNDIFFRKGNIN